MVGKPILPEDGTINPLGALTARRKQQRFFLKSANVFRAIEISLVHIAHTFAESSYNKYHTKKIKNHKNTCVSDPAAESGLVGDTCEQYL